jgi:nucleotide-binding universal stress UspA family protein
VILGKSTIKMNKPYRSDKMVPKLHRMLYATDLSADSIEAIRYAIKYARKLKANLIIFHVFNRRSIAFSKIRFALFNETQEYKVIQEKADAALMRMENLLERVCEKNLQNHRADIQNVEYLVVHYGRIAEEIVEKANRWGCELLILGPRRKRFLGRIFLPSVARRVIRRTDKRVHIIKIPEGENQCFLR